MHEFPSMNLRSLLLAGIAPLAMAGLGMRKGAYAQNLASAQTIGAIDLAHIDPRSWMTTLDGTVMLNRITVPGTHESGATRSPVVSTAKCQTGTIRDQLDAGIRFLDIRCMASAKAGDFRIYHGIVDQQLKFVDVLEACEDFLGKHPGEFIFIKIKQENSHESDLVFGSIFSRYVAEYPNLFYLGSSLVPLDTVRGNLVLIADNAGLSGGLNWQDNKLFNKQGKWKIAHGDYMKKWHLIEQQLVKAKDELAAGSSQFFVNAMNASGGADLRYSPKYFSKELNRYLLNYLERYPSGPYGLITMDFALKSPGSELIQKVIASNFVA